MATARDVARLAGCSNAVVSYVFNNGPRPVAAETRRRVLDAAAKLNYRPDSTAAALSGGKSRSIGLIVPDITNPFFAELARELEAPLGDQGYLLLIGDAAMDEHRETRLVETFVERRVDALVYASMRSNPEDKICQKLGIPVVSLRAVGPDSDASSVAIDYEQAAYLATRHLADQGHTRIGLLSGPGETSTSTGRVAGFRRATQELSLSTSERSSNYTRAAAAAAFTNWWESDELPDAIFVISDEQAIGVLSAAHHAGLSIPDDLAVVSVDGTAAGRYTVPSLTSVRQPVTEMAASITAILLEATPTSAPVHEIFEPKLIVRESSVARVPRSAYFGASDHD
ncbi:LacI family DNA-binding transcriptional regulator [Leucobacter sp. HY1908]